MTQTHRRLGKENKNGYHRSGIAGGGKAARQELVLLTVKTDAGIEGHSMGWGIRGGKRLAPPLDIPIAGVEWAAGRYQ